jgi:hypothetical protein
VAQLAELYAVHVLAPAGDRAALDAFIPSLFIVAGFELNYEVHKRRSANFCCNLIKFDQGRRRGRSWRATFFRYATWMFALALLICLIEANAAYMVAPATMAETTRFTRGGLASISG